MRHDAGVVELPAHEGTDHAGENQVRNGIRFLLVATTKELLLRDDLRDDERQQHRDPETRQFTRGEGKRDDERMMDDGIHRVATYWVLIAAAGAARRSWW